MNPKFLWTFPAPGTTEDLHTGGSWDDLGPAPAAIGPIAEYDSGGMFQVNGTNARERYIFATGGGFDTAYLRGRGVYVLHAWSGQQVWRFYRRGFSRGSEPPHTTPPILAPVSLLDTHSHGVFHTTAVGYTRGQSSTTSL